MTDPEAAAAALAAAVAAPWDGARARASVADLDWSARAAAFEARYTALAGAR
jgi:hypothetical protein